MKKLKYINHRPEGKDKLKEQSHFKLAQTIANHLGGKEEKIRLIGLEGEWGSGKTNLLRMVDDKLPEHSFFEFDLWGNQNDNLRNVFLTELFSHLKVSGILNEQPIDDFLIDGIELKRDWNERLKHLFSQRKSSERSEVPKVNPIIIILGLAVAMAPFLKPLLTYLSKYPEFNSFLAGLVGFMAMASFVLILTSVLTQNIGEVKNSRGISSLFYVFKGKKLDSTIVESVRNSQPTVSDFRNIMKSINANLKKDLVIVYDNMDRLRADQVNSVWSSIHTFFAEKQYDRIWVIVAYDRKQILSAFNREDQSKEPKRTMPEGEYFIQKTFPFTYQIPPLVLTGWKDFIREKLREAFGVDPVEDQNMIINLYDIHKPKKQAREIIVFVNELVKSKIKWGDVHKLRYHALFILNEDIIMTEPNQAIIDNKFIRCGNRHFFQDKQVQNIIGSLAYNISVEEASEVTLYDEIKIALREKSTDKIQNLIEHPSFQDVLEMVVSRNEIDLYFTIGELDGLITESKIKLRQDQIDNIFNSLASLFCNSVYSDQKVPKSTHILMKRCLPLHNVLLTHTTKQLASTAGFTIQDFANEIVKFDVKYKNLNVIESLKPLHNLTVEDTLVFIEVIGDAYKRLNYNLPWKEIEDYLCEELPDLHYNTVGLIRKNDRTKFEELEKKVTGMLTTTSTNSQFPKFHVAASFLRALTIDSPLIESYNPDTIRQASANIRTDDSKFRDVLMLRLTVGGKIAPGHDHLRNQYQNVKQTDIDWISNNIEKHMTLEALIEVSLSWNNPILYKVLSQILNSNRKYKVSSLKQILAKYDRIASLIDIKEEVLFKNMIFSDLVPIELRQIAKSISKIEMWQLVYKWKPIDYRLLTQADLELLDTMDPTSYYTALEDLNYAYHRMILHLNKMDFDLPIMWTVSIEEAIREKSLHEIDFLSDPSFSVMIKRWRDNNLSKDVSNLLLEKIKDEEQLSWLAYKNIFHILKYQKIQDADWFVNELLTMYVKESDFISHVEQNMFFYKPLMIRAKYRGSPFRKGLNNIKGGRYRYPKWIKK